jgi:hypothetical protein
MRFFTGEDFRLLARDEIRCCGATSMQVMAWREHLTF